MKNYEFTIRRHDGTLVTAGVCRASQESFAEGYATLAAMRCNEKPENVTIHLEEVDDATAHNLQCYATRSKYTEWLERKRYEAAYDAANGYDLDDEGFSFHDYS